MPRRAIKELIDLSKAMGFLGILEEIGIGFSDRSGVFLYLVQNIAELGKLQPLNEG